MLIIIIIITIGYVIKFYDVYSLVWESINACILICECIMSKAKVVTQPTCIIIDDIYHNC